MNMATGRPLPRFVPTLTDVVGELAPPLPLTPSPAPLATAPGGVRLDPPTIESAAVPAPAPTPALTPELQAAIAERVQALLQERLRRAMDSELKNLEPLIREAMRQVLARP